MDSIQANGQAKPKTDWERGKDALERIMKFVSVEKLENLAAKIEDKNFRSSMYYQMFLKSL